MRRNETNDGITALAVAGTHVVLLGWDMDEAELRARGVLGFSIQRRRHSDDERIWMSGMKTFQAVDPDPDPGVPVSSFDHPIQSFQWSDFTTRPGEKYTYRIVARTGVPGALLEGGEVRLTVTTERVDQGKHAIFFNRGAVASQEYARRFQNRRPDDVGQAAFDWLSRGLVEGLEAFIGQAGAGDELFGAFYEFKNARIYGALKEAKSRGAAIEILYDGKDQKAGNEAALQGSGIKSLTSPRTKSGRYAHNKFIVLRRGGVAEEVWTGSTNLSSNGIFGHSNNAHVVRQKKVAKAYHAYWEILSRDETKAPTAQAVENDNPAPPDPFVDGITAIFSPRQSLEVMDWYAEDVAGGAERALFTTFAFGMNQRFVKVYEQKDDVLRFALMEKKGNGQTFQQQAKDIDRIRKLPNTVVAVGHKVELNELDRWLDEIDEIVDDAHVLYVHTKYMLVDPLGDAPVVVVGSANFSDASTITNDENMLVIRGDRDVADVYLGEFMRLFAHYAFRESLQFKNAGSEASKLLRKFLIDDATWIDAGYFRAGNDRALRRLYFSGQ